MKFHSREPMSHLYPVMAVIAILVLCAFCTTVAIALAAQPPELQVAHWALTSADDWRSGTLGGLTELLANGGAESDQVWEFVDGVPIIGQMSLGPKAYCRWKEHLIN